MIASGACMLALSHFCARSTREENHHLAGEKVPFMAEEQLVSRVFLKDLLSWGYIGTLYILRSGWSDLCLGTPVHSHDGLWNGDSALYV